MTAAKPSLAISFNYEYDEIAKLATSHESFQVRPGYDLGNLPKFYSLEPYGAGEVEETLLWKKEISRLVKVVNSGSPHHIKGEDEWFGKADAAGYSRLDRITTQIQHAYMICSLDNELIALDLAPDLASTRKITLIERALQQDYDVSTGKIRYKRPLSLESFNERCYYALVDHITANLAQLLARLASGKFWEENFIITVAKLSAKLKWLVLRHDLPRAVTTVISTKKETIQKLKAEGRSPLLPDPKAGGKERSDDEGEDHTHHEDEKKGLSDENIPGKGNRYFVVQMAFHNLLSHLCETLLDQLASSEEAGIASDVFETSVVIYDTGYLDRRAMICGLRDGGIGGLGNVTTLRATQAAVQVCGELFMEKEDQELPPPTNELSRATLYFQWDELGEKGTQLGVNGSTNMLSRRILYKGRKRFYQMKDVIDVLVPIQMLFGSFSSALEEKFIEISTIAPTRDRVEMFDERKFVGTSIIQTSGFQEMRQKSYQEAGNDTHSVWETHLAQERGLAPRPGLLEPQLISDEQMDEIVRKWKVENEEIESDRVKLQKWAIDENSITVPFKLYAWGTLVLAATIVIGGVLFGFLIGNRIHPVDPFNVTIFFWGFAAFLVLFLKSFRVAQWDWRDFILGRIVCHSVSEIAGVSGINDQRLLTLLLRMRPTLSLQTKAPYNTIFNEGRQSNSSDGLAVDKPLDNKAMAAGGFLFIKVDSLLGPALVGLNLNKWSTYDCVYAKGEKKARHGFICRDFDERRDLTLDGRCLPLLILCTNSLQWHRTLGVYKKNTWYS